MSAGGRDVRGGGTEQELNDFVWSNVNLKGFVVPGLEGGEPHASGPGFTQRRLSSREAELKLDEDKRGVRKTCGRELTLRYQVVLAGPTILILLVIIATLVAPSYTRTNMAFDELSAECQGGMDAIRDVSLTALDNLTRAMTHDTLETVMASIRETSVGAASEAARDVWAHVQTNRLVVGALAPNATSHYMAQPSFVPPGRDEPAWQMSAGPTMLALLARGATRALRSVFVGWETNEFAGIFRREDEWTFGQAPPASGATNVSHFHIPAGALQPDWNAPAGGGSRFEPTMRPWYQQQAALRGAGPLGAWSDLYVFSSGNSTGMTFSLPMLSCDDYSCLSGVIAADLGTGELSEQCTRTLAGLLESASAGAGSAPWASQAASLYVVQNKPGSAHAGTLVAASNLALNASLTPATAADTAIVRESARLVSGAMPFGNAAAWESATQTPWTCTTDLSSADPLAECGRDVHGGGGGGGGPERTIVTALRLTAHLDGLELAPGASLELAVVLAIPANLFVALLEEQVVEVADNRVKAEAVHRTEWKAQVAIVGIVAAMAVLVSGVLMAFAAAFAVTAPLKQLEESMQRIRAFRFDVDTAYHSRVREVRAIQETFGAVQNSLRVFSKFVPATVVRNVVRNAPDARVLHVRRRAVTVLFSDVGDFTSISERLSERELLLLLTKYLTVMTRVVEAYGGVVGEVLGDGILAFWNTPDELEGHAALACASALAQQRCVAALNAEFGALLGSPLRIRIGVNTGVVLTGNIGSMEKMKFGCVGDPVNTASRLEGLCKVYEAEVVISGETRALLPAYSFTCRELDLVRVKGRQTPTRIFELVSMEQSIAMPIARPPQQRGATLAPAGSRRFVSWAVSTSNGLKAAAARDAEEPQGSAALLGPVPRPPHAQRGPEIALYEAALHLFHQGRFRDAAEALEMPGARRDAPWRLLRERVDEALAAHGEAHGGHAVWDCVRTLADK